MSPDRVIYSFIVGWVVLVALLIALDWLGNPNRGGFRPKGERPPRDRFLRKSARTRRRLENDAAIRAALRDAYGASSLRLNWNRERENRVRQIDDALVVAEPSGEVLEAASREIAGPDHTAIVGDPLPNVDEREPIAPADPVAQDDQESEDESAEEPARAVGWTAGDDPLALTGKGTEPAAATIRSRVWKNHAQSGVWDPENLDRLRAGKPPRRTNPITGRLERATVDVESGRATWGSEPVDPFAGS